MKHRTKRRLLGMLITCVLSTGILYSITVLSHSSHQQSHWSGWIVFSGIIILMLFGLRKKLNFIPLGKAYSWAQVHYYLAISVSFLFLFHTHWEFPNGGLDILLYLAMCFTLLSGVFGLVISRLYPALLSSRGPQVLFERIPSYRNDIKHQVEELVTSSLKQTKSSTLPEFYENKLMPYLSGQANYLHHIVDSSTPYKYWRSEFESIQPFLNEHEQKSLEEIKTLTLSKTHLDLSAASYQTLRYWLFAHIPASYLTVILAGIHAIQMTQYS